MINSSGDLLSVFKAAEKKIQRELHVATLAIVKSIDTDNMLVRVQPFPILLNQPSKLIDCIYLDKTSNFQKDDIVCVLFLDKQSYTNLVNIRNGKISSESISNTVFHSESYGIIVKTY